MQQFFSISYNPFLGGTMSKTKKRCGKKYIQVFLFIHNLDFITWRYSFNGRILGDS